MTGTVPEPVLLAREGEDDGWATGLAALAAEAAGAPGDAGAALGAAPRLARDLPFPGEGGTRRRWELLASLAAADLTWARALEAHLDALAILHEAGGRDPDPAATWGVFAAEGPGVRLDARRDHDRWVLDGTKPWCSLASRVSHALVTAHRGQERRLFAVRMGAGGVLVRHGTWAARGLVDVPSGPVDFLGVPAEPVGAAGWYLERPGFAWGGIGVAACWYGGAVGTARRLLAAAAERPPDQVALAHLGAVDVALHAARAVLTEAAADIDAGHGGGLDGVRLAARVRGVVAACAETVLARVGHGLGPAPLTLEEEHARRVADLTVYLRQHHAERDDASLGRSVLDGGVRW